MKTSKRSNRILGTCFKYVTVLMLISGARAQNVPPLINYQGKLTDQTGTPLPPGSYSIQFRLWDSPTASGASDLIWDQQQTLTLQNNGIFNVILGSTGGTTIAGTTPAVNSLAYAFGGTNCFLGVTVVVSNGIPLASPSEIVPRQQLLSAPYAVSAQNAQFSVTLAQAAQDYICPPGTITAYGGANIPNGWFLCDGRVLSSSQYSRLYNAISTNWGAGTSGGIGGTNDFNLPDLRGVFLRGVNGSRTDSFADPDVNTLRTNIFIGGNTGNAVGSYQPDMFAAHTHVPLNVHAEDTPFGPTYGNFTYMCLAFGPGIYEYANTTYTTGATGGNETRSKNAYVNYIIKF